MKITIANNSPDNLEVTIAIYKSEISDKHSLTIDAPLDVPADFMLDYNGNEIWFTCSLSRLQGISHNLPKDISHETRINLTRKDEWHGLSNK